SCDYSFTQRPRPIVGGEQDQHMSGASSNHPASSHEQQLGSPTPDPGGQADSTIASTQNMPVGPITENAWPIIPGYEILEPLGHGGMGVVYKAKQLSLDRLVAIKVIRPERLAHPDSVRRFRREAQSAAKLLHPHIVTVFDAGQIGDLHYCVMEYCDGQDLQRMIHGANPLGIPDGSELLRQAALGLQHAHERGLVHRDIKPANLIVQVSSHGAKTLKLLDLGLARFSQTEAEEDLLSSLTTPGLFMGTVDFVAPEQAENPKIADIRSDLYSLGCTFYFALTGQVPFPAETT